jgi:hypothetical protein
MSVVEQFPYCDRNPASGGLDLMPDLPIILRHQTYSLSGVGFEIRQPVAASSP